MLWCDHHGPSPRRKIFAFDGKESMASRNYWLKDSDSHARREAGELEPTDEELIRRSKRGDRGAFHGLVARHTDGLYRLADLDGGKSCRRGEDLVQEAAVGGVSRARIRFRGERRQCGRGWSESSPGRWLITAGARDTGKPRRWTRRAARASGTRACPEQGGTAASDARMDLALPRVAHAGAPGRARAAGVGGAVVRL